MKPIVITRVFVEQTIFGPEDNKCHQYIYHWFELEEIGYAERTIIIEHQSTGKKLCSISVAKPYYFCNKSTFSNYSRDRHLRHIESSHSGWRSIKAEDARDLINFDIRLGKALALKKIEDERNQMEENLRERIALLDSKYKEI